MTEFIICSKKNHAMNYIISVDAASALLLLIDPILNISTYKYIKSQKNEVSLHRKMQTRKELNCFLC